MKKTMLKIFIVLMLFVSAFFVATQPITPKMALVSSISLLAFAYPTYFQVIKKLGKERGIKLLVSLGVYALIIESLAIKTGFPYGDFIYKDVLGNKVFGLTPWTVAFAYPPIVLLSYSHGRSVISQKKMNDFLTGFPIPPRRIFDKLGMTTRVLALATILATSVDLVLDPAAVKLGFWYWPSGGVFYNVPVVNFLGWILTSFISVIIIHRFANRLSPDQLNGFKFSGLLILVFWTFVNLFLGQWLPVVVGVVLFVLGTLDPPNKSGMTLNKLYYVNDTINKNF